MVKVFTLPDCDELELLVLDVVEDEGAVELVEDVVSGAEVVDDEEDVEGVDETEEVEDEGGEETLDVEEVIDVVVVVDFERLITP